MFFGSIFTKTVSNQVFFSQREITSHNFDFMLIISTSLGL